MSVNKIVLYHVPVPGKRWCHTLLLSVAFYFLAGLANHASAQSNARKLYEAARTKIASDTKEGEKLIKKYLRLGIETNNVEILAKTDYLYGLLYYYKSRFYISNKYYSQALRSIYAKGDPSFAESCWNNMGINYEIQNLIPESLNAYQKSLLMAEKMKDSVSIGQSWINLGLLNAKTGNFNRAKELLKSALGFFTLKRDTLNIALCYQNLSYTASNQQMNQQAIDYTLKAYALHRKINDEFAIASDYYNLGCDYAALNMNDISAGYLDKALKLSMKQDREGLVAKIYSEISEALIKAEKYAEAGQYLKKAMALLHKSGALEAETQVYSALESLYAKSGDYESYRKAVRERVAKAEKNFQEESSARFDELQALYEFHKNTEKIENQARDIITQRKQLLAFVILTIIMLAVLIVITFMYLKMRRYMRSLFENRVQQTKGKSSGLSENAPVDIMENAHLEQIYSQVLQLLEDKKWQDKVLSVSEISAEIGTNEATVYKAVNACGKKDYNSFLDAFYIDEICKKMIEHGRKISLKQIAADSVFENMNVFNRKFKEITGLTPVQFMDYSEQKLQIEKKKKAVA